LAHVAEPAKALVTADELTAMPRTEGRTELVDGKVIQMSPTGARHGRIAGRAGGELYVHVRQTGAGEVWIAEVGFILRRDPDCVRAPDVAFVRAERLGPGAVTDRFFDGAPDLAVEVVSPSDSSTGIEACVQDYLRAGTSLVWVVYPELEAVRAVKADGTESFIEGDATLSDEELLPGFELPLALLFA